MQNKFLGGLCRYISGSNNNVVLNSRKSKIGKFFGQLFASLDAVINLVDVERIVCPACATATLRSLSEIQYDNEPC